MTDVCPLHPSGDNQERFLGGGELEGWQEASRTFVVDEAMKKARLARGGVANDDEFEEVIVSFRHPFLHVNGCLESLFESY